jgi:hypothetical protein
LSFRASGGVWVLNAAFIVFHIPMIEILYRNERANHSLLRCFPSQTTKIMRPLLCLARYYDQIRFRFRTAKTRSRH